MKEEKQLGILKGVFVLNGNEQKNGHTLKKI
jgi:hypothetical protein